MEDAIVMPDFASVVKYTASVAVLPQYLSQDYTTTSFFLYTRLQP